jgi:predicted nucleic acid-binding Zn ribbon protein
MLSKVLQIWGETVGDHVANHVQPVLISQDTLVVEVDQPAWSTEVSFMASRILATLERQLGSHVASAVKARVRGRSGVE